ncbi:MAG: bifunctional UDP-N-acetylglucosamine diphosphorylase/glucosamine-1-phosphate N-acetyltransferase GlmU [Anaerolineae bacterium]
MMLRYAVVVLAAGEGTRMNSHQPKVLHPVAGAPMVSHVLKTATSLSPQQIVVVVGHAAEQVKAALGNDPAFAQQTEQLGTAHAAMQAREKINTPVEAILVLYGDTPLITGDTLAAMLERHAAARPAITMLTARLDNPTGYGRIIRDQAGHVVGIVEEAVTTDEQKAVREINTGFYVFDAEWLWPALERVQKSPAGEYYLTDLVELAVTDGRRVEALQAQNMQETLGINTRAQQAEAEAILRDRIRARWLDSGVAMIDPSSTWIDADVSIGADTVIYPNTYLHGRTVVGSECSLGPGTLIRDSRVGDRCQVVFSMIEEAVLEDDVDIGPYSHLRRGAHLGRGVHIGNFGEIKNSTLGPGVKMGHFSYLGDATVGEDVNIGAGTITCNYDGERKHPTIIEEGAFIGSDTMLVAPVTVGAGSRTGAGSVVTRDVPPESLAYGVPARVRKPKS